ncbi:zinc finger protein (macronuclear) [Tetrahymena thermophila SB210]|uniref:Zinc finger protein n=1 Tax=Tetrahymena thermophila (strain SB210) TaxID=312017 RepID=Q22HK5_TETTS|nr:zinc finger protein [Tetrahymena thermophila SB210]EAR84696.4 zinc finger protein [Tetrahymena thermophila SB210]|eukprot:XP_001032359.4 zinc finger protein [Tetrahymena thermophila SB210]
MESKNKKLKYYLYKQEKKHCKFKRRKNQKERQTVKKKKSLVFYLYIYITSLIYKLQQKLLIDTYNKERHAMAHQNIYSQQPQSFQASNYDIGQQVYISNQNNSNQSSNSQTARTQIMHINPSNSGKYKTSICRHFRNGNCQLGNTCHFAHGQDEMRNVNDPLPNNIPQQPKVVCNNFKTVKCRYFEKGFCKNQHACCFAHGDQDLQYSQFVNPMQYLPQHNKFTDSILLISILQNLEHVFPNDPQIIQKLQYAQQIARNCDQKGAFNIISDIMKDPKRTEEEKGLYNTIYTNAQMFYSQQQQLSQAYMPSYQQMGMYSGNVLDPTYYMQQQLATQQQQAQFKTN